MTNEEARRDFTIVCETAFMAELPGVYKEDVRVRAQGVAQFLQDLIDEEEALDENEPSELPKPPPAPRPDNVVPFHENPYIAPFNENDD